VISKPAGIVVHPAAGHRDGTLVNALLFAMKSLSSEGGTLRPGIVHRLDRDTSGLMVVAKNDRSYARLKEMIKSRELKRMYLALVHGVPDTKYGMIDAPVGRDPKNRKKMTITADYGKPALTVFRVVRTFKKAALLHVELITGRTHQIRVHLSYIGHPVAGDRDYGKADNLERELSLRRQFLHAYRLSFSHPITGVMMEIEDPLPSDLNDSLEALERA